MYARRQIKRNEGFIPIYVDLNHSTIEFCSGGSNKPKGTFKFVNGRLKITMDKKYLRFNKTFYYSNSELLKILKRWDDYVIETILLGE